MRWWQRRGRQGELLTAALVREDGSWTAVWLDGHLEPVESAPTLESLARGIDGLVRDRYGADPTAAPCLQYAIYPWGRMEVFPVGVLGRDEEPELPPSAVFHISGNPGHLRATDISGGSAREVEGRTLDDLVSQVSALLGDSPTVSFRWIREIHNDDAE